MEIGRIARPVGLAVATFALAVSPARAGDGVVELNQTCATQTGCLAGDAAGFPITLVASGSYRLTSNLVVPDANTSGISVATSDVSIDLGGFTIRGPVVCSGNPLVCTPNTGTGVGVGAPLPRVTVRDGEVVGLASGLSLSGDSLVSHVIAATNRLNGIQVTSGSAVADCVASDNGGSGIFLVGNGVIRDSSATGNGSAGISAGNNAAIRGNASSNNGGAGITTGIGASIVGNSVRDNGSIGIQAGSSATIADNSVFSNGGTGIAPGAGSLVRGNTVVTNTGFGLSFSTVASGYSDNVINGNTGGTVASGTNLGGNLCNGSTTCP